MRALLKIFLLTIVLSLGVRGLTHPHKADAAAPTAMVTNAGASVIQLLPEQGKKLAFQFLNTGMNTWRASGATPIRFRFRGYGASQTTM